MRTHWRLVEEELAEGQQRWMGLAGQLVVQMTDARLGQERKEVGLTGTEVQEGWEVAVPGPRLGSGVEVGQGEVVEEEYRKVTLH